MPTIRPEIQKALRQAGLDKSSTTKLDSNFNLDLDTEKSTLERKLETAGLSLEDTLDDLRMLVKNTQNDNLRLRATETILKMHQALKEQAGAMPSINIIIQDPNKDFLQKTNGVNPILLPRELHVRLGTEE